mgnify:CR=1 FL=1|tara:strand:- start:1957 stop:2124 length:168 start_codon:yes stop_codon:yes gene_type:complete
MSKYILVISDDIIKSSDTKAELLPKYNAQVKVYKESGGRLRHQPVIYKVDTIPTK